MSELTPGSRSVGEAGTQRAGAVAPVGGWEPVGASLLTANLATLA